jgi:hypothetical protein
MNRAQLRAMKRAKPVNALRTAARNRGYFHTSSLDLIELARQRDAEENAGDHVKTLYAFERIKNGTADQEDVDHVSMVLNIVHQRALDIDETLADMIELAMDAMERCIDRYKRIGRYGFDGPGLTQMYDALHIAQEIIDNSSKLQMRSATRMVVDLIIGEKGAWRRVERMMK